MDLRGATLGLVGFGRIGRAVAARAAAFGMKIIFADPSAGTEGGAEPGARKVELERLVMEADVVSLHCPYSPKLHHMFGARQFEAMKPSAIFINTARGKLHDERALAAALQSGAIAGAGLDVYEYEPRFDPALAERDNVVMLPHIGSATKGTRDQMALLAARNVIAVLDGERPLTPVNEPSLSGRGPGEAE